MFFNKKILIGIPALVIAVFAVWLWTQAGQKGSYYGLPVVPCVDSTKPIVQNFSFTLRIEVNGKDVPLGSAIGHDPGKCLRVIHTDDASGKVTVTSNDNESYTLQEFFNVWHEQFTPRELMGNAIGNGHGVTIYANGASIPTLQDTLIHPNDEIRITYR